MLDGIWDVAAQDVATDERFRCRCAVGRCSFRATQEDLRCNACRKPGHAHAYFDGIPLGVTGEFVLTP